MIIKWNDSGRSAQNDQEALKAASEAAARVNAMLIAKGKLKPKALSSQSMSQSNSLIVAEVEINDVPLHCRNMLTRGAIQEEIAKASGAAISTRGRYVVPHLNNGHERSLYLCVQGSNQESVDIAVQRINELINSSINTINIPAFDHRLGASRFAVPRFDADIGANIRIPPPIMSFTASSLPPNHLRPPFDQPPPIIPPTTAVLSEKLLVGLEHSPPSFDVKGKISGPGASYLQHIEVESGAKVTLEGRGSGTLEPGTNRETLEPMNIHIQHSTFIGLQQAKSLAENLLQTVQQEYVQFQQALASMPPVIQQGATAFLTGISAQNPGAASNGHITLVSPSGLPVSFSYSQPQQVVSGAVNFPQGLVSENFSRFINFPTGIPASSILTPTLISSSGLPAHLGPGTLTTIMTTGPDGSNAPMILHNDSGPPRLLVNTSVPPPTIIPRSGVLQSQPESIGTVTLTNSSDQPIVLQPGQQIEIGPAEQPPTVIQGHPPGIQVQTLPPGQTPDALAVQQQLISAGVAPLQQPASHLPTGAQPPSSIQIPGQVPISHIVHPPQMNGTSLQLNNVSVSGSHPRAHELQTIILHPQSHTVNEAHLQGHQTSIHVPHMTNPSHQIQLPHFPAQQQIINQAQQVSELTQAAQTQHLQSQSTPSGDQYYQQYLNQTCNSSSTSSINSQAAQAFSQDNDDNHSQRPHKRRFTETKPDDKLPENLLGYEHGPPHLTNLTKQQDNKSSNIDLISHSNDVTERNKHEHRKDDDKVKMPPPPPPQTFRGLRADTGPEKKKSKGALGSVAVYDSDEDDESYKVCSFHSPDNAKYQYNQYSSKPQIYHSESQVSVSMINGPNSNNEVEVAQLQFEASPYISRQTLTQSVQMAFPMPSHTCSPSIESKPKSSPIYAGPNIVSCLTVPSTLPLNQVIYSSKTFESSQSVISSRPPPLSSPNRDTLMQGQFNEIQTNHLPAFSPIMPLPPPPNGIPSQFNQFPPPSHHQHFENNTVTQGDFVTAQVHPPHSQTQQLPQFMTQVPPPVSGMPPPPPPPPYSSHGLNNMHNQTLSTHFNVPPPHVPGTIQIPPPPTPFQIPPPPPPQGIWI